jgi:hypothetical protein
MLKDQLSPQSNRPARSRKLSPELDEFLHMLDALEDQVAARAIAPEQAR